MVSKIERRKYVRMSFGAACKITNHQNGGFIPGRVVDVSEGGVGLAVESNRHMRVGDIVDIGVDWTGRSAVVESKAMIPGKVVRVIDGGEGLRHVGVSFDRAADLTLRLRSAA